MRSALAVLVAVLVLEWARGDWVQVPVIDGGRQATTPGPTRGPLRGPQAAGLDSVAPPGPPGPNLDDVITIRRTVGDSYSNKQGAVPGTQGSVPGTQGSVPGTQGSVVVLEEGPEAIGEQAEAPDDGAEGLSLRVLREAHQTLLRHSAAPVSGKLDFLRRLKNRMLKHIASLMPLTAMGLARAAATGRAMGAEGRGHKGVGFPSNESTLLSLAFLVFAVFLVKVVMQLIYAVQNSQATSSVGVRVAQMPIPGAGVSNMMGTMMSMVPAMMPPMMAAMNPSMGMMGGMRRARRGATAPPGEQGLGEEGLGEDVDRMTSRVLEAIHQAKARLQRNGEGPRD